MCSNSFGPVIVGAPQPNRSVSPSHVRAVAESLAARGVGRLSGGKVGGWPYLVGEGGGERVAVIVFGEADGARVVPDEAAGVCEFLCRRIGVSRVDAAEVGRSRVHVIEGAFRADCGAHPPRRA